MCLADLQLQGVDPVSDGISIAEGLEDTAKLCRADQVAIAARMLLGAHVIRGLLTRYLGAYFAAAMNNDTIKSMHREMVAEREQAYATAKAFIAAVDAERTA